VSGDGGASWDPLGKVTRPAVAVAVATPLLTVLPPGTIAGVTPDTLIVRVPATDKVQPRALRVLARDEASTSGAISTNIPARGPLFRCLAPPVGSRVLLEREDRTTTLPINYTPRIGDPLLIVVSDVLNMEPPSVVIDNKVDGEVVLAATGGIPKVLARVKQPLRGIGRYAGTERAGSGGVVSWSPTTVLVSSAGTQRRLDESDQPGEERGGFVIQPAEPRLQGATNPASQLLLEAVPEGEARPPISRFFTLPMPLTTGDPLDKRPTRVEVRIDEGDWEPFPDIRGAVTEANMPKALEVALGGRRTVKKGITQIRLTFGTVTEPGLRRRLRLATLPAAKEIQRGKVKISANVMGEGVSFVSFSLNGKQVKLTNLPPFDWEWDTRTVPNGEHLIEIKGLDTRLVPVTTVVTKVIVDN
jgi:hypothetical protein